MGWISNCATLSDMELLAHKQPSPMKDDPTDSDATEQTPLLAPPGPSPRRSLSSDPHRAARRNKDLFAYCAYYVPLLRWLPTYTPQLFFGDLVAGLTLACLLVPQRWVPTRPSSSHDSDAAKHVVRPELG
jgi:hypothetical protein